MRGAFAAFRISAALPIADFHGTGHPASSAIGGRLLSCASSHGSARLQAPSALTIRPFSVVIVRSSHTQPHTVQAKSVKTWDFEVVTCGGGMVGGHCTKYRVLST